MNSKKNYMDYVNENIDINQQWEIKNDFILGIPSLTGDNRDYGSEMSELEKIFYLSMYHYINPVFNEYSYSNKDNRLILSTYSDCEPWFRTYYQMERKYPVKPLIRYQYKCGKYKIDFAIIRKNCKIAIELDGFKWHDRDKKQFAYERERQNFLVGKGFIVLRYTWKSVTKNMDQVAREILAHIEKGIKKNYKEIK